MRTGSAVDDAVLQSRRLTIQHLRPIAWAHARDGVARYSGSGISEIDTGLSLEFAQSDANLRPTRGFTAGQVGIVPISPADQVTTPSTAQAVGDFTIAVLWWCSNTNGNVPDFIVRDSASGVYLLLTSVSGPAVRATVGSVLSNTIAISTGRPFVAVLTYLDGSQTGTLRCNGSSEIATDNGLSTDNVTIDLVVNTADEICASASCSRASWLGITDYRTHCPAIIRLRCVLR
jgi:hypothetical protein